MKKLITTIALIVLPFQALALSESEQQNINNQQNQVIQNQRQIERAQELQSDLKQVEKEQKEIDEESNYLQKNNGKVVQDLRAIQCFRVAQIVFSKNKIIPKRQEKIFAKPRVGKCLTIAQISEFGKEISNYLAQNGYATSRAEIPVQSLNDKILKVNIVESHLEKIIFNEDKFFDRTQKFAAFGWVQENEILNLQKIDQGIDQINRLSSNHAVAKILPGESENGSIVAIENQPKNTTRIGATYDNFGNQLTGAKRDTITFSQDNLLKLNDAFTFSRTANDFDALKKQRNNKSISGNFSIPFANHKLTLSYSKSEYFFLTGTIAKFRSHGTTTNRTASIDSVWFKNKKFKSASTFSLNNRNNENFIDDTKTTSSSRISSLASVALSNTFFLDNASLFLKPSYARSVNILNNQKDPADITQNAAHSEFNLFKFYANYSNRISSFATYSTSFDSQYTKQRLYGNDKFSVGGVYSVRGFQNGTISEDSGYNIRNEIVLNLGQLILPHVNAARFPTATSYLNNFLLTPFYDYGAVRAAQGQDGGRISGAGFKIGFNRKNFNGSLTYSHALSKSQMLYQNYSENKAVYFDLSTEIGFF